MPPKYTSRNPRARRRSPAPAVAPTATPEPAEEHESLPFPGGAPAGSDALRAMSEGVLRSMTEGIDVPLAVELERALEQSISAFATTHAVLVRKACDVPDSHVELEDVVWCTFLGHVLQRLEGKRGRPHVERLTAALLDQFVRAREQVALLMGTLQ